MSTSKEGAAQSDPFVGKKIPPMPASPPDLSKVRFRLPTSIFNGKSLTGWRPNESDKISGWSVKDGGLVNATPKTDFSSTGAYANLRTKAVYKDFWLHIEFLIPNKGGNSGVYLQNRYEIQVLDGDKTKHGMGAVINETESPYHAYNGLGKWNAYDIVFRAAQFKDGKLSEKAKVSMYFNGKKVHTNITINQVWGGKNSGLDGGNDGGKGITDVPGGLKLQCEGHDVRYRNAWVKELDLKDGNTDF